MTQNAAREMRFLTMIKCTVVTSLMLLSFGAVAEGTMESIDPRDMSLGFPIEVASENAFDLADRRDYGSQDNGRFILKKSDLRNCIGNYFYIHLGDEQYRSYEEEMEEDRQQIMKDKLMIENFEAKVDNQGNMAKKQTEVDDYNDKVKIFNELTVMQSGHVSDYNNRVQRLNDFGARINQKTANFSKWCNAKDYYQDEYEDLILTVKEEMFDEFNRALNRLN